MGKKLTPLQTMQRLSQMSGDKVSLRWAKTQEARKAAQPKVPKPKDPKWVSKNMSVSAFGVEHGGEIAKADDPYKQPKSEYRRAVGNQVNPRSKIYVKRGTGFSRMAHQEGGSAIGASVGSAGGSLVGAGIGLLTKKPGNAMKGAMIGSGVGAGVGAVKGTQMGRSANIKNGNVVAINRRTGATGRGRHAFFGPPGTINY